ALEAAARELDLDPRELEKVEERLFALRGLARKHHVPVADLADLQTRIADELAAIEAGAENVGHLVRAASEARTRFIAAAAAVSRFMLALKLVLADTASVPTLIFDEVDSGIGGAVAAAVGERLQRLGTSLQVLVVTHSPQVAARGAHHWRVAKRLGEHQTVTRVEELNPDTRQEEIARMLSGRTVTAEARAAAASLIAGDRA